MLARSFGLERLRRLLPPIALALLAALLLPPAPPVGALPAPQQTASPPNVVVIMADDLDLASTEQLLYADKLPNLKSQIVDRGTTFANSFVTYALCCPSRATFLTGQYTHNHKVFSNLRTARPKGAGGFASFRSPDQERNTLPAWLDNAGYQTGHVGKYLNGYTDASHVPIGWDEWQTLLDYTTYLMQNYRIVEKIDSITPTVTAPIPTYQTAELASRAVSFITRTNTITPDQPFFLMVTPLAPHIEGESPTTVFESNTYTDTWTWGITPPAAFSGTLRSGYSGLLPKDDVDRPDLPLPGFDLPALRLPHFNEADVSDKPVWLREDGMKPGLAGWPSMTERDIAYLRRQHLDRLEALMGIDALLGQITTALSETGDLTNTLLVFTSDNGFLLGEHRLSEKFSPYEESIRVPLYIRLPGQQQPQVEDRFVVNTDLPATILDYTGAGTSAGFQLDGRSLRPLLEGAADDLAWRKRFLVEYWYGAERNNVAFFDLPDYAAVRTAPGDASTSNQLYVEYDTDDEPVTDDSRTTDAEHYLLDSDRYQLRSRHNDPTLEPLRALLSAQLNTLRECRGTATDDPLTVSCKEAEDLPDDFWASCEPISAAFTRPLYNPSGDVSGQRQLLFGGGAFYSRDIAASGTLAGWVRYSYHNAWKDDQNPPPTDRVDAAAFTTIYAANGAIDHTRQLIYGGETVWTRDSLDRFGASWPLTWTSQTLQQAWGGAGVVAGPPGDQVDAVAFSPLFSTTGALSATRQLVYAGETVWARESLDRYGNEWPTRWVSRTLLAEWGTHPNPRPPIDSVDAVDIVPVYQGDELVALRQAVYAGNAVWTRESLDTTLDLSSVTTWTVSTYAQAWEGAAAGGWYVRPPIECSPLNAQDDTANTGEDVPLSFAVLGNDSYRAVSETLALGTRIPESLRSTLRLSEVVTTGLSGTLALLPEGELIYTPTLNFAGTEVFSYTLADNRGHSSVAWVTLVVTPTNDPPAFASTPPQLAVRNQSYRTEVVAADADPADGLTVTATLLPGWLTLSDELTSTTRLTATGSLSASDPFSGTAAVYSTAILSGTTDIPGDYAVVLQVADSSGALAEQRFSIAVRAQPLFLPLLRK